LKNIWYYDYPIGEIGIIDDNGRVAGVCFADSRDRAGFTVSKTQLLNEAAEQLSEYFNGTRRDFELPLSLQGTEFQQRVWHALRSIPYGETRSYKEIAIQIGRPRAARPVGMANNKNPIAIIIPCHRVVGHDGRLVGYGGGLHIKRYLLELEKRHA